MPLETTSFFDLKTDTPIGVPVACVEQEHISSTDDSTIFIFYSGMKKQKENRLETKK